MNIQTSMKLLEKLRFSLDELDKLYQHYADDKERPVRPRFSCELRAHCDSFKQRVESFIPKIFDEHSQTCQKYLFRLQLIHFYTRPDNTRVVYDRYAEGRAASEQLLKLMHDELEHMNIEQTSDNDEYRVKRTESILPYDLCLGTRGYIESLANQINATYETNAFDGCAVLMRRLVEILLIHAYKHLGIEGAIKTAPDKYKTLDQIIADAKSNVNISLTKDTRAILDDFRKLGNFSAHKIEYTCRRSDISRIRREYRVTIEELLYKSGLKR